MITLEVVRGTSADWLIQAANRTDGSAPTTGDFLVTDTIAATVSIGEGYPSLFAPDASWTANGADVTTGLFSLSVDNADTDLDAGDYLLIVSNTRSSRTGPIVKATFRITGAVGTDTAPATYCTYQDLKDELPWIGEIKDETSDLTGFAKQRGKARDWMDALILMAQPQRGTGLISTQHYWTWDFGTSYGFGGTAFAENTTLRGYLDDDLLILTGPYGKKIVDACTYWTLANVLRRTAVQKPGMSMAALADYYERKANAEASTCTATIDTNADGEADIAIPLGIANIRYA